MHKLAIVLLSVGLLAVAVTAQKMGMVNRNAPTIEQKMDLGSTGVVSLKYSGITWASGAWAESLQNEETRGRTRERINQAAGRSPLGSFECSKDVELGDVLVPAGAYKLAFMLNDAFSWEMSLAGDAGTVTVPLSLMQTEMSSKRLVLSLYAGDEDFTGGLYLAFGADFGMMTITPAGENEDEDQ